MSFFGPKHHRDGWNGKYWNGWNGSTATYAVSWRSFFTACAFEQLVTGAFLFRKVAPSLEFDQSSVAFFHILYTGTQLDLYKSFETQPIDKYEDLLPLAGTSEFEQLRDNAVLAKKTKLMNLKQCLTLSQAPDRFAAVNWESDVAL